MTPHLQRDGVTLYHGDCLDVLRSDALGYDYRLGYAAPLFPDASVDSVVCDPPYGLEFMGKDWDSFGRQDVRQRGDVSFTQGDRRHGLVRHGIGASYGGDTGKAMRAFQQWCEQWAAECLRVLKPGGHLLAFGGTRTWHRLACAVEDAGFEVRDSIAWLYGSGFPKSLDVSKAITAHETQGGSSRRQNRMAMTGDESRSSSFGSGPQTATTTATSAPPPVANLTDAAREWAGWGTALKPAFEPVVVARKPLTGTVAGNVLEWGTGALNIDGCRIEGGELTSGGSPRGGKSALHMNAERGVVEARERSAPHTSGRWPANVVLDESQADALDQQSGTSVSQGGSRGAGGQHGAYSPIPAQPDVKPGHGDNGGASRFFYIAKADASERPRVDGTAHPTVKPLALMRWLVRLVTPPGGVVLEPFAGSGTTVEACIIEGFECVAVEKTPEYLPLIEARIARRRDPVRAVELAGEDQGLLAFIDDEEAS